MNRIFKVIWSKAKNCYVVASELAKSRTKSPRSNVISHALVVSVLTAIFSFGAVMPVLAAAYSAGGGSATGNNAIAIGPGTSATSATAIGGSASATGTNAVAVGDKSQATGLYSVASGVKARALGAAAVAIGDSSSAYGHHSLSLGYVSVAHGNSSFVIGDNAYTKDTANNSIALGTKATVYGQNSVAIGSNSYVSDNNVISFGHRIGDIYLGITALGDAYYTVETPYTYNDDLFRKLINVADGTDDHDVATWGQTKTEVRVSDNGNYVILPRCPGIIPKYNRITPT